MPLPRRLRMRQRTQLAVLLSVILPRLLQAAVSSFPSAEWSDRPNPLVASDAVVGGQISVFAGQWPKSFNYYLDNNTFSAEVFGAMYESLLSTDPMDPALYVPALASRWSISADKRTFTFRINPRARWSDGKPVTAKDVQWTFNAIMDPKNMTGPHKVALERFKPPEVLTPDSIRFTAKQVHWRNLMAVGSLLILPAHAFADRDFNKINYSFPVVSGPCRIGEIREGVFATLVHRADWWNRTAPSVQHIGNFATIKFRFYAERENAFEAFKKGQLDLFPVYTARLWVNQTRGDRFSKNWIVKQKVFNHKPIGFQGFAMNMRRPPFDDLRVRHAMALLVDRRRMNRLLMYNQYFLHRSYYEDLYDKEHPCPNPIIEFDKGAARKLLADAGWTANPDTGILEKNGRRLAFKFLTRSASTDRFLAIFSEDLKDVGVQLTIDRKDWAAWARDMDHFNFDMTWAAWGAGIYKDPEGMWSSREADRQGGSNITGFKDAEVDRLIQRQKSIFDLDRRNDICRRIDHIATARFPYVLLWNLNYTRLLYWNKFGTPRTVLSKYGDESSAY